MHSVCAAHLHAGLQDGDGEAGVGFRAQPQSELGVDLVIVWPTEAETAGRLSYRHLDSSTQ